MEKRFAEVMDMLAARDARRDQQAALLKKYASPLICFTLNIAGPEKRDAIIDRAFADGVKRIEDQLCLRGIAILEVQKKIAFTGDECIWAVRGDVQAIKRWMCAIEDDGEIGRLYDIDVIDADGKKLSRGAVRKCMICGGDAFACARARVHSWQELSQHAHRILDAYFDQKYAARIGMLAQRALMLEASVTPKPGLVDNENNGSHRDMNRFTLIDSACCLRPFFDACVRAGIAYRGKADAAYDRISYLGVCAEADMRDVCGTNAHKGALFSLGILCCAAAMAGEGADADAIFKLAGEIAAPCMDRFLNISADTAATGGECQYLQYGLAGARGEAAAGFPTVRNVALPALRAARARGMDANSAAVHALLQLMACVQDSNILRRGGADALRAAQNDAQRLLNMDYTMDDVRSMNDRFVQMHISPGGSADLLAAAIFIDSLKVGSADSQ